MNPVDLNCDMGELPALIADGTQVQLMRHVTSVNIACGAHAGDDATMRTTIDQALAAGVAIGAHPGYEDREHFGRLEQSLAGDEIAALVHRQLARLDALARERGAEVSFVKPHGALYNQAAADRAIAAAIATGVARWRAGATLVCLAGPAGLGMLEAFRAAGLAVAAEAFADRRYEPDGRLRSRQLGDSLLSDPAEAAAQALRIARREGVIAAGGAIVPLIGQTICIHSDTPGSVHIAQAVRAELSRHQFTLQPFAR